MNTGPITASNEWARCGLVVALLLLPVVLGPRLRGDDCKLSADGTVRARTGLSSI
jgi:hypothetical protein